MDTENPSSIKIGEVEKKNRFDPFNNRLARDIRNGLSEALIGALVELNHEVYLHAAGKWNAENLPPEHRAYIQDRLQRYRAVLRQIQDQRLNDPFIQALVIWNQGLFFEFHEHLETIWRDSTGDERQALMGMIKAAGVYVHLEFHHQQAAERLAAKSIHLLNKYSHCLAFIANLDILVAKLKDVDSGPPQLNNPEIG
jgi:hypothetical protein